MKRLLALLIPAVVAGLALFPSAAPAATQAPAQPAATCFLDAHAAWAKGANPPWGKVWVTGWTCSGPVTQRYRVHLRCRARTGVVQSYFGATKTGTGTGTNNDSFTRCPLNEALYHMYLAEERSDGTWNNYVKQYF
jgi:hypothetical protein